MNQPASQSIPPAKANQATRKVWNLMSLRRLTTLLSIMLIIVSIGALMTRGLSFGIDFTGGYLIEVEYDRGVELDPIRQTLSKNGFAGAIVQYFGAATDIMIRLPPQQILEDTGNATAVSSQTAGVSDDVLNVLEAQNSTVQMRRVEFVGPQVGEELVEQGGLAVLYALIGILIYVYFRFEWKFSLGSVLALVHDVLITLGIFAITGVEFDLPVLAAILAVIGYSLNDTIVVYDRIRENFRALRAGTPPEVINVSVNETLSRTLVTSVTTMLVLLALFFVGGEIIHGFAFALIIGVLVGTYSSIFVASPAVLALGLTREDLLVPEKEGEDLEDFT